MGPINIRMNDQQEVQYYPITARSIQGMAEACDNVNDWATKKGWNKPVDDAAHEINIKIATLTLAIKALCLDVESVRKGKDISPEALDLIDRMVPSSELENLYSLDRVEARQLAQLGLMCTEISEGAEAIIEEKHSDDHCPQLPALDAEMADLAIRMFHFCGEHNIELGSSVAIKHDYNTRRPHMHGKKA